MCWTAWTVSNMNRQQVNRMMQLLPAGCRYLRALPSAPRPAAPELDGLVDRMVFCTHDPEFGFRFVQAHLEQGVPMDPTINEESLHLAYNFLQQTCTHEQRMVAAWAFHMSHPQCGVLSHLIKAHLICPEISYHKISQVLKVPVASVRLYEELFFNVRDRMDEPAYINGIMFPETRVPVMRPGYGEREDPHLIVLRLAYDHGIDPAMAVSGRRSAMTQEHNSSDSALRVEGSIMSTALTQARIGIGSSHALGHARQMIAAAKIGGQEQGNDGRISGLESMALRHHVSDEIKAYNNPDTRHRLLTESFTEVAKKSPDAIVMPGRVSSPRPGLPPAESPELIARLRSAGLKKEAAKVPVTPT